MEKNGEKVCISSKDAHKMKTPSASYAQGVWNIWETGHRKPRNTNALRGIGHDIKRYYFMR